MGYEWAHSGSVRLRSGAALQDVLNLYPCEADQPHLPLTPNGEAEFEDGQVWLKVDDGFLEYKAEGDSWWLDETMTEFLRSIAAALAAEGWIDYEVEDFEVPYGPTERSRTQARLESAQTATTRAQQELALVTAAVRRLEQPQA